MFKVAVIGCGRRGVEHVKALRNVPGMHVVAIADSKPEVLRQGRATLALPAYLSLDALLQGEHPDVVVLATPARGRAELVERAAGHPGVRAILAEKPLALTLTEADRMRTACESRGIALAVGSHWRFCPELAALKQAVGAGTLGMLELVRGVSYGNLLDQGWHLLDAIRWLTGGRDIIWAMSQAAHGPDPLSRYLQHGKSWWVDDAHPVPMWMTHHLALEGDVRVSLETGLLCPRSGPALDDWHQRRICVLGTGGMAECRPGAYFQIQAAGQRPANLHSTVESLQRATQALHEDLRDALLEGRLPRTSGQDAVRTLEGLVLCAQSARDGCLASHPLVRSEEVFTGLLARSEQRHSSPPSRKEPVLSSSSQLPRFSVIVPLMDNRGIVKDCLTAWTRGQTFPRDAFEVIVVSNGSEDALDAVTLPLLAPGDRLVHEVSTNRCKVQDRGAREARGQWLLFTESHVIPEPQFLTEMEHYLSRHDYVGACCRSIGVAENFLARARQELFEMEYQKFCQEGHWHKVIIHGFALRRDVYLEAGGLPHDCQTFGEKVLAATLRARGCRLGYAAGAAVRHYYREDFAELLEGIEGYVGGELEYRAANPGLDRIGFTYLPALTSRHPAREAALRDRLFRTLTRDLFRRGLWYGSIYSIKACVQTWIGSWLPGLLGPRWPLRQAALRCYLWRFHHSRLLQGYQDFWNRGVDFIRLKHAARPPAPANAGWQEGLYPISAISENDTYGFHGLEQYQQRWFRWTSRAALLCFRLQAGNYQVRLDTAGLRGPKLPRLQVFFNQHRLPPETITFQDGIISFPLSAPAFAASAEPSLVIVCEPSQPWKHGSLDRRELGLPVFSLEFTRTADQNMTGDLWHPTRPEELAIVG